MVAPHRPRATVEVLVSTTLFLSFFLSHIVRADIPAHCLLDDYVGHWQFRVSDRNKHVPDFKNSMGEDFCLHKAPNANQENLDVFKAKPTWEQELGPTRALDVHLTTEEQGEAPNGHDTSGTALVQTEPTVATHGGYHRLLVRDAATKKAIGSWTPIYDEGMEVHIGPHRFFAFSGYSCAEEGASSWLDVFSGTEGDVGSSRGVGEGSSSSEADARERSIGRADREAGPRPGAATTSFLETESSAETKDKVEKLGPLGVKAQVQMRREQLEENRKRSSTGGTRQNRDLAARAQSFISMVQKVQQRCGKAGAQEDKTSNLPTGYQSLCGQTNVGWYRKDNAVPSSVSSLVETDNDAAGGFGCFWGAKKQPAEKSAVSSFVLLGGRSTLPKHLSRKPSTAIYHRSSYPGGRLPSYMGAITGDR